MMYLHEEASISIIHDDIIVDSIHYIIEVDHYYSMYISTTEYFLPQFPEYW